MLFKEIIDAFRGEDALSNMLRKFDTMLETGEKIFQLTDPENASKSGVGAIREEIYRQDREINELERKIRYAIVRHMSVNPGHDAGSCLVLTVVAKDAERIGDYGKNIFEVLSYCGPERYSSLHQGELGDFRKLIGGMIPSTRKAFSNSDLNGAQEVIQQAGAFSKKTDQLVQRVLQGTEDVQQPAARVLLARHYKRISSHLSNICTAITSPVDMLGYHDEPDISPKD